MTRGGGSAREGRRERHMGEAKGRGKSDGQGAGKPKAEGKGGGTWDGNRQRGIVMKKEAPPFRDSLHSTEAEI